jgi:acyl-CoA synthetase (AMP-forming)/AMP-acid ligase II
MLQNQDILIDQASAKSVVKEIYNITIPKGAFEVFNKVRNGVTYPAFLTLPNNLGEMFKKAADTHGHADFLIYQNERYSFETLYQLAISFREVLRDQFNIKKGDKVVIAMRNYPEWLVSFMGITMLGAVAVPINAWWSVQELLHVIQHSEALLVITDDKRYTILQASLQKINMPCLIARPNEQQGNDLCLMRKIESVIESVIKDTQNKTYITLPTDTISSDDVMLNDTASIFYTSGSTGFPKGAVSTHESILTALNTWLMLGAAAGIANGTANVEPAYPAAALMTVPLFHVTGCHTLFLLSMLIGRKTVMMPYWDAELALILIEKERVTYFNGVPTMSMELMNHPQKHQYDLTSLLDICAGGAARAPEHVRKISQSFAQGNPSCGYGLTETNALGAVNGPVEYLAKPTSAGLPTPPIVDIQIFNDANQSLPQGQVGEIAIKSLANISGYWRDVAATDAAFSNGYFKSGDLGFLDEDGFIHIVDRIKDIIIRGGENISCLEVESALYKHSQVIETSVFALPDPRLGEVPGAVAYVKNIKEIDEDSLRSFLTSLIAHFKVPSKIWLVEQKLPRLGSGKIDKRGVKTHYQKLV